MLKFVFLVKNILAAFKKRFTSVQDSQFLSPNDNASHEIQLTLITTITLKW